MYIYTLYIYSIRQQMLKKGRYPTVILWLSYGYPTVEYLLWFRFSPTLVQV